METLIFVCAYGLVYGLFALWMIYADLGPGALLWALIWPITLPSYAAVKFINYVWPE